MLFYVFVGCGKLFSRLWLRRKEKKNLRKMVEYGMLEPPADVFSSSFVTLDDL
jgi:hypothetical protein